MDLIKGKTSKSSLGGLGKFIKYAIFVVNFLLFVGGLAVTALGVWVLVSRPDWSRLLNGSVFVTPASILLAFGCLLAFVTFLGCCGAILENKCLVLSFFVVVLIITVLIVVGVALLAKNKDQALDSLKTDLTRNMERYYKDEDQKEAWDYVQRKLQCCGVNSVTDWGSWPPKSCKCTLASQCVQEDFYIYLYWQKGCAQRIQEVMTKLATPLLGVAIAVMVILILTLVFSCALFVMLLK